MTSTRRAFRALVGLVAVMGCAGDVLTAPPAVRNSEEDPTLAEVAARISGHLVFCVPGRALTATELRTIRISQIETMEVMKRHGPRPPGLACDITMTFTT